MRHSGPGQPALDDLDRRILRLLHSDGRMSYSDIARTLACNEATARKRVERLLADGALAVVGVSNPYHLGFHTVVWIGLHVDLNKLDAVADQLARMEELSYVACSSGQYDIIATAAFETDLALYEFLSNKLATVDGIRATHTSHLLRLMRRTFTYRVPAAGPEQARTEQRPILMPGDPSRETDSAGDGIEASARSPDGQRPTEGRRSDRG